MTSPCGLSDLPLRPILSAVVIAPRNGIHPDQADPSNDEIEIGRYAMCRMISPLICKGLQKGKCDARTQKYTSRPGADFYVRRSFSVAQLHLTPMKDSSNARLWMPKKDKSGGVFKKNIAQAALKSWDRLREYAARERIDSSFAADIVESIVKTMSARRSRSGERPVRNLGPYIFATFTRRIKRLAARERRIEYIGTLRELESFKASEDWEWALRLENRIQAEEAIGYMDEQTRRTYLRRLQGFSWKVIAKKQGVSVNGAIKSYSRGLSRVRERMLLKRNESQSEGDRSRTT